MSLMSASRASARVLDHAEEFPLLRRERRIERKLGHADDAVHRRADLVAHVREEIALGLVRALGLLFGRLAIDHLLLQIARALFDEADELALAMARAPDLHLVRRERRADAGHQRETAETSPSGRSAAASRNATDAPASFQTPSLLAAITLKV